MPGIVRISGATRGFTYDRLAGGGNTASVQAILEIPALGNGFINRGAVINVIVPFGSVPMFGGAGVATIAINSPQLRGTLRRTVIAVDNNADRADAGRRIEFNGPANGTYKIGRDGGGAVGQKTGYEADEILIDNISAFTCTVVGNIAGQECAIIYKAGGGGVVPAGGMRRLYKKRDGAAASSDPTVAGVAIWYLL